MMGTSQRQQKMSQCAVSWIVLTSQGIRFLYEAPAVATKPELEA